MKEGKYQEEFINQLKAFCQKIDERIVEVRPNEWFREKVNISYTFFPEIAENFIKKYPNYQFFFLQYKKNDEIQFWLMIKDKEKFNETRVEFKLGEEDKKLYWTSFKGSTNNRYFSVKEKLYSQKDKNKL